MSGIRRRHAQRLPPETLPRPVCVVNGSMAGRKTGPESGRVARNTARALHWPDLDGLGSYRAKGGVVQNARSVVVTVVITFVVVLLIGAIVVFSGLYNVSAAVEHTGLVGNTLMAI